MRTFTTISKLTVIFVLIFLSACTRVSQTNYDRIKNGMTMQQVVSILGEPTSVDNINIMGFSGSSALWRNKDAVISIQFLNNQVQIKSFNKADKQSQDFNLQINTGDNNN